jgi:hypothetical protein
MPDLRGLDGRQGKSFFSEEKKQKTFILQLGGEIAAPPSKNGPGSIRGHQM